MADENSIELGKVVPSYLGDWVSTKTYSKLDTVVYNNAGYIAIKDVAAGVVPGTDSYSWRVTNRGAIGPKGDKGDTGTIDNAGLISMPAFQSLQAKVDNSVVGTNLLTGTGHRTVTGTGAVVQGYLSNETTDDFLTLFKGLEGQTVTISADYEYSGFIAGSGDNRIGWEIQIDTGKSLWFGPWFYPNSDSGSGRISSTFMVPQNIKNVYKCMGHIQFSGSGTGTLSHLKLEKNSVATDWIPAQEDWDTELQDRGINVKWFGAVGDGSTDDSAAFQKAIDAAYANFSNLASRKTITGSFEVDVPSGVYEISTTLVLPPMVKLKAIGFVQLKYKGKSGTSCIWVKQKDDVSKYPNEIIHKQAYTRGNIIDGSSGGLMILRDGPRDCIGLAVGNNTDLGVNFPVSRYSMQGVMITGFDEGIHWYAIHHYIGNYYSFHLEDNNTNLMVGDDDIAMLDSNENFSFYSSVFAGAPTAAVYTKTSWDINFFGCSFDFNNVCFKDSSDWGKINLEGCHLETNRRILQKKLSDYTYTLTLKQCRIILSANKLFEGKGTVNIRDCNFIEQSFQTIDSLADDTIYLEESNSVYQDKEVILRLIETQSKDGNMISSDVSAFSQYGQTNANNLSKTTYNGKPALLISSSGTSFSTSVALGILENVQPFKHSIHAAIKYVCNHSSDDYDLFFGIAGDDKYKGLRQQVTLFSTTPVSDKNVETLASKKTSYDASTFDPQGIRPYIVISTKQGVDASDFKFYVENVHIKID